MAPLQIYFETHGEGPPLVLGYPLTASHLPQSPAPEALAGYLRGLTDHYRVLVMDYPGVGRSGAVPPHEFTPERACADLLQVVDAAGFERFAWWGYSWGGLFGLLLAGRTERLTALVCGGWPPLGGLHREILEVCRVRARAEPAQQLYVTFYENLTHWPEREWVRRLAGPRLAYVGSEDVIEHDGVRMDTATKLRAHRAQLEGWGWDVEEISGADHDVWTDAAMVVPRVRPFLDKALRQ